MIGLATGGRVIFLHAAEVELIREGLGHFPAARVWNLMAKLDRQQREEVIVTVEQTAQVEAAMGPVEQLARWETYEDHGAWERRI